MVLQVVIMVLYTSYISGGCSGTARYYSGFLGWYVRGSLEAFLDGCSGVPGCYRGAFSWWLRCCQEAPLASSVAMLPLVVAIVLLWYARRFLVRCVARQLL